MRRKHQNVQDVHQRLMNLQAENERLKKTTISIQKVEELITENRKMKVEINQFHSMSLHSQALKGKDWREFGKNGEQSL